MRRLCFVLLCSVALLACASGPRWIDASDLRSSPDVSIQDLQLTDSTTVTFDKSGAWFNPQTQRVQGFVVSKTQSYPLDKIKSVGLTNNDPTSDVLIVIAAIVIVFPALVIGLWFLSGRW